MGACHDLVTDTVAGGEKGYTMFLGKFFNQPVFAEIGFSLGLNLVIKCKDWLLRVLDSCSVHRPVAVNRVILMAFQRMLQKGELKAVDSGSLT